MVRSAQEGNPEGVLFDGSNIGLRAGPRQVQCAFRDKTTQAVRNENDFPTILRYG